MIALGSHNSWTFRKPVKWYTRLIRFMGRCQDLDIVDQYKFGITVFDMRVKFVDGKPCIHHGIFNFGEVDYKDFDYLNCNNDCAVRIILESNVKMKDQVEQERLFIEFCKYLEDQFPKITFFGGNRKFDWKVIYDFHVDVKLLDMYSSTTSLFKSKSKILRMIDDLYPRLYAELRNKKNFDDYMNGSRTKVFFYDFVGKYI